jgi:kynurenine formamidase
MPTPPTALLEALVAGFAVVELGHPLHSGMTSLPTQPGFRSALMQRHGDRQFGGGLSAANEMFVMGTHVGTHVDAFCHISHNGLLHEGVNADESQRGGVFSSGSIDLVGPFVNRGVLIDAAAHRGVERLAGGEEVTARDLDEIESRTGLVVGEGDVVCIRTGWAQLFDDGTAYLGADGGCPGVDESAAHWCVERGVVAVGTDTLAFDAVPGGGIPIGMPAHRVLLVENQVSILENLQLEDLAKSGESEFVFVGLPLRIVGATGSPMRPIALV